MNRRARVVAQEKEDKWHTKKWYKENYGVDPSKLGLPFEEAKNPHYSNAAPMKLWKEPDVSPFRDEDGVKKHVKRKEAGKKAFETREKRLEEWFTDKKSNDPRVQAILKRLWEVRERISELHLLKEECREDDPEYSSRDYFDFGIEHCEECERMTIEQCKLKEGREELFSELEHICESDKRTIQLARKYLREKKGC